MTDTVDHVLLTRFNLPSAGVERSIREQEGWLTNRWGLFERYCVPSVQAQTNQNFTWIIYFDPQSPAWLIDRVQDYAITGLFRPIYRASVSRAELLGDIRGVTEVHSHFLATTNLDNDDAIAIDFVDRIQRVPRQPERTAVFLANGLVKSPSGVYWRVDRDNAFCTVVEPWDAPTTCWSDWHMLLRRSMPVIEERGAPGWLQVVHGENVSNHVRGRLTSPQPWIELFPGALGDVTAPGFGAIASDRLVRGPARATRELLRGSAKRIALGVLGKDGLDRVKVMLSR